MGKCKWCGNHYKEELFSSGFCSKKCEIEGGDRGVKRTSPIYGIVFIIVIIAIIFFSKSHNSPTKQEPTENTTENTVKENYTQPEDNLNTTNSGTNISNESSEATEEESSQNESTTEKVESDIDTIDNESNSNNYRMTNYQEHQKEIDKAIEMLKQDKSVSEIENLTTLERKEIRQLRRKLKNEE